MMARACNGEVKAFSVVETIHKDNICHTTEAPARVPPQIQLNAQQVATQAVACLEGAPGMQRLSMLSMTPHQTPPPPAPPRLPSRETHSSWPLSRSPLPEISPDAMSSLHSWTDRQC